MPKHASRELTRIMYWFLKSIGLYLEDETTLLYAPIPIHFVLFEAASFSTLFTISMYGYVHRDDFNEVVTIAAYLGCNVIFSLILPNLYARRNDIKCILQRVEGNLFRYSDEHLITVTSSWTLTDRHHLKKAFLLFGYTSLGFSLCFASPIVELYVTGNLSKIRVYPSWYPWSDEHPLGLAFTFGVQAWTTGSVFWYYYTLQVFSSFMAVEFLRQKERLCAALATVGKRADETAHRRKLVECFRHYREIIKTFDLYKPWFTYVFAVELLIDMIMFAFVFYNILEVTQPHRMLTLIGSSINVIFNLFSRCIAGEMFLTINEDIASTIVYDMEWYTLPKDDRDLLKIFHLLVKIRSNEVKAFSTFPASYFTFAGVTRLSYTYLGLIKATLKK